MPARLLIVDDSPLYRLRLSQIFVGSDKLQIVGIAGNGREAITLIQERKPDVLLLDLEMPELDGFSVLRWTMEHAPMPVVICSGQSDRDSVFQALEAGAVDFITKPQLRHAIRSDEFAEHLRDRVESATEAHTITSNSRGDDKRGDLAATRFAREIAVRPRASVVGLVGSAGSPAAVAHIATRLRKGISAPIIIALHMPQGFTRSFADRLARLSRLDVSEAHNGGRLSPRHIYVAPGGFHTTLRHRNGHDPMFSVTASEEKDFYAPSADQLLASLADCYGPATLGVVLTGMGEDGLNGARLIKKAGGSVIAESRESAVIWGMPRAVVDSGLADAELNLSAIATVLPLVCERD
jgi:two-component system chemotaxis response regulator CheB